MVAPTTLHLRLSVGASLSLTVTNTGWWRRGVPNSLGLPACRGWRGLGCVGQSPLVAGGAIDSLLGGMRERLASPGMTRVLRY